MDKVRPKDCAFTLMELLVVIAIIAILAALLLPVLSRAKARATGIQCLGNLKQLQFAWQMYVNDHNNFIPGNNWWTGRNHFYSIQRWWTNHMKWDQLAGIIPD
jgi:prepilin-type N-terminal cleavage/methylation domain-containing protein